MGKVKAKAASERERLVETLRAYNPRARIDLIEVYVSALLEYRAAQKNIDEHGAIVLHPRSGAPIANPYIVVRDSAQRVLLKCPLRTDCVWQ